jgi:hypothetical protein
MVWEVLGYVFAGVLAVLVLVGLVIFVQALPDLGRYRRIRKM